MPTQSLWHVGNCISHHSHGGNAESEMLGINFVERVSWCVVNVKVVRTIHIEAGSQHTFARHWSNIRAASVRTNPISANPCQQFGNFLHVGSRLRRRCRS